MVRAALVVAELCAMLSPSAAQNYRTLRIPCGRARAGLEALVVRPTMDAATRSRSSATAHRAMWLAACEKTGKTCSIYAVDDRLESNRLRDADAR